MFSKMTYRATFLFLLNNLRKRIPGVCAVSVASVIKDENSSVWEECDVLIFVEQRIF